MCIDKLLLNQTDRRGRKVSDMPKHKVQKFRKPPKATDTGNIQKFRYKTL